MLILELVAGLQNEEQTDLCSFFLVLVFLEEVSVPASVPQQRSSSSRFVAVQASVCGRPCGFGFATKQVAGIRVSLK